MKHKQKFMKRFSEMAERVKSYHDTTQAVDLQEREYKAKSQDKIILEKFRSLHNGRLTLWKNFEGFTPRDITLMLKTIDLNDVRRSINTLTRKGLLTKTENKVMECKGAYNYLWKLNK